MSCGSAPSRVYFTASRPSCSAQAGPCTPCPVGDSFYLESAFKSAEPACDAPATVTPLQVATVLANQLDGSALAATRADGDAGLITFALAGVLAGNVVATVRFSQAGITVLCDVVGTSDCGLSRLQVRAGTSPSPNDFADLVSAGASTSLQVTFADSSTHTAISRVDAVGAAGFFSA